MSSLQLISDFLNLPKPINDKIITRNLQIIKKSNQSVSDTKIHALHEHYFQKINCLDCANCCKSISPGITDKDVERLAKFLKIKPSAFIDSYLTLDTDGLYMFTSTPCPFLLADNYCSVYAVRPRACKEYPHTDRRKFNKLIAITAQNISVCPAVFHIISDYSI